MELTKRGVEFDTPIGYYFINKSGYLRKKKDKGGTSMIRRFNEPVNDKDLNRMIRMILQKLERRL